MWYLALSLQGKRGVMDITLDTLHLKPTGTLFFSPNVLFSRLLVLKAVYDG